MTLQESWAEAQRQHPDIIVINEQVASRARSNPDAQEARDFYARLNDPGNGLYEPILTYRSPLGWAFLGSVFQTTDEKGFTNLAKINPGIRVFRRTPLVSLPTFQSGWHGREQDGYKEWRWSTGEATIAFQNPREESVLSLELEGRPALFDSPQRVDLTVGGRTIDTFLVENPGVILHTTTVSATDFGNGDLVELTLLVDSTFVPAELPGSNSTDDCRLGVRVFYMLVDSR